MGAVIGDLLPLGLSVTISPIPIVAVILMLLSGQAARTSTGFLAVWVAGIVVVTVVVLLLVGQAGNTSAGKPSTVSSVLKLVFGMLALVLVLAVRQWRWRRIWLDGPRVVVPGARESGGRGAAVCRFGELSGPVRGRPQDQRHGWPGARTYSGQRRRNKHRLAALLQVRGYAEV